MPDKKDILPVLIILFSALAVRFFYYFDYKQSVVYPVLEHSDSDAYRSWAKDNACGDFLRGKAFMKWPFYAYFLGLWFFVFGENIPLVYFLQFTLGALNCILIYLIAKKIFNRPTAFIAGILSSLYGLFVFYEGLLIYTSLSLLLNSLLFLCILKIRDHPTGKKLFFLGLYLGICTLTQANILIFGILAVIWALWVKRKIACNDNSFRFFLSFFAGLILIIGSVTLRNYLAEKDFVLVAGNIGFNFYSGNNPEANGTFWTPGQITLNQEDMFRDARVIAENESGRKLKTSQVSAFWRKKAANFIIDHPQDAIKLFFRKLSYAFSPREYIHDIEFNVLAERISIVKAMLMNMYFILPFAFLGMITALKRLKEAALLYLAVLILSLSIAVFFVTARYRLVLAPYLIIFAGYSVFSLWQDIQEKKYFRFALFSVFPGLVFILFNIQQASARPMSAFDRYFNRGLQYEIDTHYAAALREFTLAQSIEPKSRRPAFRLGVIYYKLHDLKRAEENFKKALEADPISVDTYYNLGFIYSEELRYAEAQEMFKKAIALYPDQPKTHYQLGLVYKELGDLKAAKKEFEIALRQTNRWRRLDRGIILKEILPLQ